MIRKDKRPFSDGTTKTWIRVVEGYRPAPGKPPKQRTIKSFGYLEDQADQAQFLAMVEEFDKHRRKDTPLQIEIPKGIKMYTEDNRQYNYGYRYLGAIYDRLGIDEFIEEYEREAHFRGEYSLREIFKYLVLYRIISPDSKRSTCQMKDMLYEFDAGFTLKNVYRSLDHYAAMEIAMQRHLNERIKEMIGRDPSFAFYDVTNYYFEIDFSDEADGLRHQGVSKEHRTSPIVQMGLFMDGNGLPVCMTLFPGNTSDTVTLKPAMKEIKENYGLGRLIVVADKGMNSSKNIDEITNNGDGYVVSQILRGRKGQRYHEAMFDEAGYEYNKDGTYKYKLFTEEYKGINAQGQVETRKRKVLIYWSKADADLARRKREEKLVKAERATQNNAYGIKKGCMEYTTEAIVDAKTGKSVKGAKKQLRVDTEKAARDECFGGYFCIITSELEYSERQIREVYGGLWRIEESFRVMKSDLDARPVYVNTTKHIHAHFLICFVALLIVRVMQYSMGKEAISSERIARAINAATCHKIKGGYIHLNDVGGMCAFEKRVADNGEVQEKLTFSGEDEIAKDYAAIMKVFNVNPPSVWLRQEDFARFLNSIS